MPGYIIIYDGLSVDQNKTNSILKFLKPKNVENVKSFLGLCTYYSKFNDFYTDIIKNIQKLLKNNIKWNWSHKQDESFSKLIFVMIKQPVLQFPQYGEEYYILTDSSDCGIGDVLCQKIQYINILKNYKNDIRVILFISRKLSSYELIIVLGKKNYCLLYIDLKKKKITTVVSKSIPIFEKIEFFVIL